MQVALAWLLHKPGVTAPIIGATRAGVGGDALASERLELSGAEIARLEEPYMPHAVSGIMEACLLATARVTVREVVAPVVIKISAPIAKRGARGGADG